ncbi:DUF4384 domain-containing protein [Reichenbachiella ulvae]|uniref:DUF4384 domain-containing protein n=1 Tax=Reichenbachiella ulvae TaxID=2980104 RepID=A0ABT3D061_9BACT|nr:DUF4384 domain-containing protein [Reichenbachiella ulvae]MCV9389206.1 DUF4384 domain-containing protein [Reichenbachiella ulvae]
MKTHFITISFILLPLFVALGQAPAWTNFVYRNANYPQSEYLIGFMSERNLNEEPEADLLNRLKGYSQDQLVESILVDIQSISTLNIHNVNANTHEDFKRSSTSVSNASIAGMKFETFYDKRKKVGYAFAYAKKDDVINQYSNETNQYFDQVNTKFAIIQNQLNSGEKDKALKGLYEMQTTLKNIEQNITMLITLTGDYNHPAVKRDLFNRHKVNIDKELSELRSTEQSSIDDAAFAIAHSLKLTIGEVDKIIRINNFTFEDTPMTSPFSRRMTSSLQQKLIQQGFKVATEGSQDQDALILNGTYWEEPGKLKISTLTREQKNSVAVASAECYLSTQALDDLQVAYKPENYEDALVSMKQFAKNEITGGGLKVEVFTNKGKDNLIYTEGEELKLFIKANKECYIRFIYHLADGSKVLLLDDYYLGREYVNKAYQLPEIFECTQPFGFEILQLNAQSEPFPPLATKEQYGYKFIQEDAEAIIQKTRGFKVSRKTEELKAEARLNITTMSR